jgi:cell division protein ZapA
MAMAQVTVTISSRQYRMACEDGQEDHLMRLAKDLDSRIAGLRTTFGEVGDQRLSIMAAITIADELSDATGKIRRLEQQIAALQDARGVAVDRVQATESAVIAALTAAAERIEKVTKGLNQNPGGATAALG